MNSRLVLEFDRLCNIRSVAELFYTEKSHLRNLKLLDELFHRPMASGEPRLRELADIVFPQLPALIKIHCELNSEMKKKMKENPLISVKDVSEMLLRRVSDQHQCQWLQHHY